MTFSKLTLAALVLGASLTPALADSGSSVDDRLAVLAQSQGAAKTTMVEGRQAAPIVATAPVAGAAQYLDSRIQDQDR